MYTLKNQSRSSSDSMGSPGQTTLGIHRESRVISKVQPKIRVIHIFAPEIINTDVENFRELVQTLTGKPDSSTSKKAGGGRKSTGAKATIRKNVMITEDHEHEQQSMFNLLSERPILTSEKDDEVPQHQKAPENHSKSSINNIRMGGSTSNMWRPSLGDNNQAGSTTELLNAFQDLDGFMQVFGELPYVPSDGNSHLTTFEDSQLSYRG